MNGTRREPPDPDRFRALPGCTRLEDTITSEDTLAVAPEPSDEWRVTHG